MRKILLLCLILLIIFSIQTTVVFAENENVEGITFQGLYLLNDSDVLLKNVDIVVTIKDENTTEVFAEYTIENTGDDTQYLYMGVPMNDIKYYDIKYQFSPYAYNSKIVSGSKVNNSINNIDVDYKRWRVYNFEVPIKPNQTKTATISYKINNYYEDEGKILFSINMKHLKSWVNKPQQVDLKVFLNPKKVELYDFGSYYSLIPKEMNNDLSMFWSFDNYSGNDVIEFDYYTVDKSIIDHLSELNDKVINNFIKEYNRKNYNTAINLGREYLKNSEVSDYQNYLYLLMADAYMGLKNYDEALIIYELVESQLSNFDIIRDKIQDKIIYNKVTALLKTEEFEEVFDLVTYKVEQKDINSFYKTWLEEQLSKIPQEEIEKIMESRKELSKIEKFFKKFLEGNYTKNMIIILSSSILIILIIILIIRKKRKNRYFF